ncbi:MAG: PQQ-like beta-propeller repeat protein [Planctomycetes bacterium]|nr:PQQ-like beta-propeller repeat protein [Planctomycetota bacterium]
MRKRSSIVRESRWIWLGGMALMLIASGCAPPASAQWTQWGGPHRDFSCDSTGLADAWPEEGPREVWSREIGAGHSSIVVDGETLYTMCRRDDQDAILAINARSGETLWETRYDAPAKADMWLDFGPGPHSTPLIVGDRIFTVGAMVHFHCLDKNTGKILWSHDLMEELGTSNLRRGYGASPIAYKNTVILTVGPQRPSETAAGIAAFKQDTGEVVWTVNNFGGGYSSPIIVQLNGEDHLVVALGADRAGLDPATGEVRWRTAVDSQSFGIMAMPLWIEPDQLLCSAGYGGGTRLFKIGLNDEQYVPEELWHYRKMQVVHGTMARVGNFLYGSSHGSFGPAFLMALDLETGKPAWRKRGFAKANVLYADGKFIILDEEGQLALATATPEGFEVHSQAKVLKRLSWTVPTLVETKLYLRDHHTIKALDLSAEANQ